MRLGRGVGDVVEVKFPLGGGESEVMEMRRLTEGKEKGTDQEQELPLLAGLQHPHHHHRHAEGFVKNGVAFLWEAEPEALYQKALFKVCLPEIQGVIREQGAD